MKKNILLVSVIMFAISLLCLLTSCVLPEYQIKYTDENGEHTLKIYNTNDAYYVEIPNNISSMTKSMFDIAEDITINVSSNVKDIAFIGPKSLKNAKIQLSGFSSSDKLTIHFEDFRIETKANSAIISSGKSLPNITIDVKGSNRITSGSSGGNALSIPNLTITGSGTLEIYGGNNTTGGNGGVAICSNNLKIENCNDLLFKGGYGDKGASTQNASRDNHAKDASNGGNGGCAIVVDYLYISNSTVEMTGGDGGNGGKGGNGGNGNDSAVYVPPTNGKKGGNGGKGGDGASPAKISSATITNSNVKFVSGRAGNGGDGGNGGNGGRNSFLLIINRMYGGDGGNGGNGGDVYCLSLDSIKNIDSEITYSYGKVGKGGFGGKGGERGGYDSRCLGIDDNAAPGTNGSNGSEGNLKTM